jgi:hypothetical protein
MPLGSFRLNSIAKLLAEVFNNRYGNAFTPTTGTVISTAANKFGGSSLRLPGGSDILRTTIPHTAVADNSNWTIEGWVNLDNVTYSGNKVMIGTPTGGVNLRGFGTPGGIVIEYYITDKNLANAVNWNGNLNGASGSTSAGTFYHFALVHYNDVFTIYGNGVANSTRGGYTANYNLFGSSTVTGSTTFSDLTYPYDGYVDEMRISNVARYHANFTPSTSAFTNDDNTIMLCKFDGTNGSQAFVDTSTPLSAVTNVYLNGQSTSTGTTIAMPNSAKVGDYAILFDTSSATTNTIPSGWTSITGVTTTGIRQNISYKKLVSGDLGATITGMASTTRKVLLVFTPNAPVTTLTISTPISQATTLQPNPQGVTAGASPTTTPVISFWCGSSTGAPAVTLAGTTMVQSVSTSGVQVRFRQWNQGETPANQTASMSDSGTNAFQSFFIRFA